MSESFNQMLSKLRELEDELVDLSNDDLKTLLGDIKDKVDGVQLWESKLKAEIARVAEEIRVLQDRKRTMENSLKRFRDYLVYTLKVNETPMIKGKVWDIKLRNRKLIKPKDIEITSTDYLKLNHGEGRKVIDRVYKWNVSALKTAYTVEPETFKDYVTATETEYIQFTATKGK